MTFPRILNVRLGHACNSSSTHSILIFPKGQPLPGDNKWTYDFGWDDFTLSSPEMKAAYSWTLMEESMGPDMADLLLKGVGIKKPTALDEYDPDEYGVHVDHQSVPHMPKSWDGKMIDVAYAQDVVRFLNRKDVVILGGNDNSEGHPMVQEAFGGDDAARAHRYKPDSFFADTTLGRLVSTDDLGGGSWDGKVARKDGNMWTLFSRKTGNRTSFSFDDSAMPDRLASPMLVDIKLTDYCAMGCPFCYQGSTTEGQHADKDYINGLIYNLSKGHCFEVAFGGGEPTEHPNFAEFVKTCRDYGIVPNVTSRNPAWFASPKNKETVELIGAVAFSAETITQAKKWQPYLDSRQQRWNQPKMSVQVIDGAVKYENLLKIAAFAEDNYLRVTVLGWKTTGRANEFKLRDQGKWLDWYKGLDEWKKRDVAVDTVIVQQYKAEFEKMGVAPESYIDREGQWSCYVDGVGRVLAPSSYGSVTESRSLSSPYDFAETFALL